jgi:hypothetical protein
VWASFRLVGREQVVIGPGEYVGDFPGEVVGVAHPDPEALADEGWGEVGGVAEQERPPDLEPCRQPGPERVRGGADDVESVEVVASGPGLE